MERKQEEINFKNISLILIPHCKFGRRNGITGDHCYKSSLLVPQTVLGSRETLKQIITRAGCWICLNIALNVGFTFWKYKHISQQGDRGGKVARSESQHFSQWFQRLMYDLTILRNDGLMLHIKCRLYFLGPVPVSHLHVATLTIMMIILLYFCQIFLTLYKIFSLSSNS